MAVPLVGDRPRPTGMPKELALAPGVELETEILPRNQRVSRFADNRHCAISNRIGRGQNPGKARKVTG